MAALTGLAKSAPDAAFLSALAAAVAAMHAVHFGLPQLNPDEVSLFLTNLSLISEPGSAWYERSRSYGVFLGPFPVMYAQYIGALSAYASAPFHHAFGPGVEAVRFYNMFAAVVVNLAMYLTARQMFSRTAAAVSASAFAVFPTAVFFSRQGIVYEWIALAGALAVLYFGMRFLRGKSLWNLAAAALPAFVIIWAYLSSLWFALGIVAALPVCVASLRARGRRITRRTALAGAALVIAGSAPFAAHYLSDPDGSYIGFVLSTVEDAGASGPSSGYLHHDADNSDILGNLALRSGHLHSVLSRPSAGFAFAGLDGLPDYHRAYDATFPALFLAGIAAALAEIARRGPYRRGMAGLLVALAAAFVASTFTVSALGRMQLVIVLPLVFLLIGCGADILTRQLARRRALARRGVRQVHLVCLLMAAVSALQAPHIYGGFELLGNDRAAGYREAADELGAYVQESGLTPVTMDWYTHKPLFFLLEGESAPIAAHGEFEGREFNGDVRDGMRTAESAGLVRADLLFVVYAYPELLDCSEDLEPSDIQRSNQCAQAFFVESAAERNGLDVIVRDFDLPNGDPYFRTLQFAP